MSYELEHGTWNLEHGTWNIESGTKTTFINPYPQ